MSFTAKYRGHCDVCDETIEVGQQAQYVNKIFGEDDHIAHVKCPEQAPPRPVCPSCFMEMPLTNVCGNC